MIGPRLVAHRGWQNKYPENTAISVENAISVGAQHIEIDIQLTADQVPYLCHDTTLNRLSNSTLNINRINSDQLKCLSAYEPERLGDKFVNTPFCPLAECANIIAKHPNVTLYVEIKAESLQAFGHECCLQAILKDIRSIIDQCIIISFDIPILEACKAAGFTRTGPVLSSWQQAFSQPIKRLEPEILFCDVNLLSQQQTPADLPFPVAIYEINSISKARELLEQGALLIETFCVGELLKEVP